MIPLGFATVDHRNASDYLRSSGMGSASMNAAMRFRVASFGSRPMPPPMLSSMCVALVVPTRATVTAGWLMTNDRIGEDVVRLTYVPA